MIYKEGLLSEESAPTSQYREFCRQLETLFTVRAAAEKTLKHKQRLLSDQRDPLEIRRFMSMSMGFTGKGVINCCIPLPRNLGLTDPSINFLLELKENLVLPIVVTTSPKKVGEHRRKLRKKYGDDKIGSINMYKQSGDTMTYTEIMELIETLGRNVLLIPTDIPELVRGMLSTTFPETEQLLLSQLRRQS